MAAAVGKKLQRTVAGDNGAVEWFLMQILKTSLVTTLIQVIPRVGALCIVPSQKTSFETFFRPRGS